MNWLEAVARAAIIDSFVQFFRLSDDGVDLAGISMTGSLSYNIVSCALGDHADRVSPPLSDNIGRRVGGRNQRSLRKISLDTTWLLRGRVAKRLMPRCVTSVSCTNEVGHSLSIDLVAY